MRSLKAEFSTFAGWKRQVAALSSMELGMN